MFDHTPDQELLAETTRRFLEGHASPTKIRALHGTKAGFEPDFWRQGSKLGWTSLVVPEEAGGGTVGGHGVHDLMLVAYEFGFHAAPGPLSPVNLVAAAVGRWGSAEQQADLLAALLSGEQIAAWALTEPPPNDALGHVAFQAQGDREGVVLTGTKVPVEGGAEAATLLVVAVDAQYLVPADAPGVSVTPLQGLDMTRRYARVDFDHVRLPRTTRLGGGADGVAWLTDLAVIIQMAETVGAMQWAFDTTLDWVFNRFSFGRPLASYQEIKHRFADLKMWLEGGHAIVEAAAKAFDDDPLNRSELVSAAKQFVGRYGAELLHDCVQLHGGIGVTFDHDMHLFLRRVTSNAAAYGTPDEHAARLGRILDGTLG